MSDTPRTNELLGLIPEAGSQHYGVLNVDDPWPDYRKIVDFTRTLERELSAKTAEHIAASLDVSKLSGMLSAAQARISELEAWLSWMELRIVDVRTPAMWGSRHEFTAQPRDDDAEGQEVGPSNLRELLRAVLAKGKP